MPRVLRKTLRRGAVAARAIANRAASPLEALATRGAGADAPSAGPVFILGAPRSGTTLLYQLLTCAFDFGYISNRHCRWFRAPVLAERLRPTAFGSARDFDSRFGLTAGPDAPSECGNFWYRFLPRQPHSLRADDVDEQDIRALRHAIAALAIAASRPMLFKNLILSLRIPVIARAFPCAVFIISQRDQIDTACSILAARQKLYGNLQQWFSARPRGCENVNDTDDPFEQVAHQLVAMDAEIRAARNASSGAIFIDVDYEDLCAAPRAELARILPLVTDAGVALRRRDGFDCPAEFVTNRSGRHVPADWRDRLGIALAAAKSA